MMTKTKFYRYDVPSDFDEENDTLTYYVLWKGLKERTTSHIIPQVTNAKGIFKHFFWILITLATFVGLGYHLYTMFYKFFEYDVGVKLEITSNSTLKFPAVTVCNENAFRKSALLSSPSKLPTLDAFVTNGTVPTTGFNSSLIDSELGGRSNRATLIDKTLEDISELTTGEKQALGHQRSDFILDCEYGGYSCNGKTFESFYSTYNGNCFIFNSGWNNSSILRATESGPNFGLSLTFNIEQSEYVGDLTQTAGVRVLVHDQDVMPFPEDQGFLAAPGEMTFVGIKMVEIDRYGGRYTTCKKTDTFNITENMYQALYPSVGYSQKACKKTCYQRTVIETCKCALSIYPRVETLFDSTTSVRTCDSLNATDVACTVKVQTQFINGELNCSCIQPCSATSFSIDTSSAYWPSDEYATEFLSNYNSKSSIVRKIYNTSGSAGVMKNLAKVHIFYKDLNYEYISEYVYYDSIQFLSDFGGALGLWLGWSVVTFFEFFELFMDVLAFSCRCGRKRKVSRSSVNDITLKEKASF
ncbi:degenerin-like protein unc-105 [Lingula anatina]|uniref:Degenerin-like protein unc-105 n=1 Tax=Lingula anatina TaxID=7574 RepID=A0A1S3IIV4_LINAN|nr:degenerin-like protein unc-105 [Lingula anatina]|eukprot:XP_013398048.1 degenerin-like protein unc-105 [Lingula anatina]